MVEILSTAIMPLSARSLQALKMENFTFKQQNEMITTKSIFSRDLKLVQLKLKNNLKLPNQETVKNTITFLK